ncbi:hypothetical protein T492DRAFT_833661 [Pavlovales sp. CCMP2436]|nr:hypothetical protein T492DRAFT_833661 [Pavlovales sp. CCMP2436]
MDVHHSPPPRRHDKKRWTPHTPTKRYCLCKQPFDNRPMIQCEGRCEGWFHSDCVNISEVELHGSYFCAGCTAKGWLREPSYCVCEQPWANRFMLECSRCTAWFHGSCVRVSRRNARLLDTWRCPGCTSAPSTPLQSPPAAKRSQPAARELPVDVWAHVLSYLPQAERVHRVSIVSHRLLAAVDATLERWCRSKGLLLPPPTSRPSRFGPSGLVATHCPWLHVVQKHGCRCCLESVGEYAVRCVAVVSAAAQLPKRFMLCRKCARRESLQARLEFFGFDVATASLSGKPLWPRQFVCPLGAAVGGVAYE